METARWLSAKTLLWIYICAFSVEGKWTSSRTYLYCACAYYYSYNFCLWSSYENS